MMAYRSGNTKLDWNVMATSGRNGPRLLVLEACNKDFVTTRRSCSMGDCSSV